MALGNTNGWVFCHDEFHKFWRLFWIDFLHFRATVTSELTSCGDELDSLLAYLLVLLFDRTLNVVIAHKDCVILVDHDVENVTLFDFLILNLIFGNPTGEKSCQTFVSIHRSDHEEEDKQGKCQVGT